MYTYISYTGKFSLVQTVAKMPPEAPEEILTVNCYFCDMRICKAVTTGLLNFKVSIFAMKNSRYIRYSCVGHLCS